MEYRFDRFRLLPEARELWLDGDRVSAPRLAFDCLAYLVENRERAVGRDELVAAVWGRVDVAEARVSELVLRVRRLIGDDGQVQRAIRTVPGFGYRWVLPIEVLPALTNEVEDGQSGTVESSPATALPARKLSVPGATTGSNELREQSVRADREGSGTAGAKIESPSIRRIGGIRSRRGWLFVLLSLAALIAAAVFWPRLDRVPPAGSTESVEPARAVMVLPLAIDAQREAGWVRLGAMELIADQMRSAGLPVLPSENVLMALGVQELDADPVAIKTLDPRLGVGMVVRGSATRSPSGWTVALSSVAADGSQRHVEVEHVDVIVAARQAADRLLIALGEEPPKGGAEVADEDLFQQQLHETEAAILAGDIEHARGILTGLAMSQRDDPRVLLQLARIDLLAGRLGEAAEGYSQLIDQTSLESDPVLFGQAMRGRANVEFRGRRFADAERDYDTAVRALQDTGSPRELGHALAGRGVARMGIQRLDAAAADLGRARIQLQQAGDRPGMAQVDAYFGLLESEHGRFASAIPHLVKAVDTFEAFGIVERTVSVLLALLDAQTELLRWPDALATSDRQWSLSERIDDPALALVVAARRGRVLLGLGRYTEAAELLSATQTLHAGVRIEAVRYLHDFRADVASHLGHWDVVIEAADQALSTWPADASYDRRAYLVLLRQRALVASGKATADLVEPLLTPPETSIVSPVLDTARAEWAVHQDRDAVAQSRYDAALTTSLESGSMANVALVAVSYARWLLANDRLEPAAALAGRTSSCADRDFDCALLQLAVLHRYDHRGRWEAALRQAQALAGERAIPAALMTAPTDLGPDPGQGAGQ